MPSSSASLVPKLLAALLLVGVAAALVIFLSRSKESEPAPARAIEYKPRQEIDPTGSSSISSEVKPWPADASLETIATAWDRNGYMAIGRIDALLANHRLPDEDRLPLLIKKATMLNYEGESDRAYAVLEEARFLTEREPVHDEQWKFTICYMQGLASLRRGETENCVMCRGESSCILPLSPSARHTNQAGSRLAVKHFTEYLEKFSDDLEVKWLLNIAHMTLDEHPDRVDPRFRLTIEKYNSAEHSIGKFRDVGSLVGINRLNMAGGAIMDDFDNDGRLDLIITTLDPGQPMAFYRNLGDGTFEERTKEAGLLGQLGGLNCVQADYNNDGFMDIYIGRGAWLTTPMRPTLLKNNGNGTFSDVTSEAGMMHSMNSDTMQWADFDNDGWLDLFVCGEAQPSRLYRNLRNGKFDNVAVEAGLGNIPGMWKGFSWFDYDNDGYPDMFLNDFTGKARLFHNNRNGTFTDTTKQMGIDGPKTGLSCWTFDYDNDGYLDIFATSYDRTLADVIKGLLHQPHSRENSRLYRNIGGKKFQDVTKEVGLDQCFSAMGTNFGDFDNDGFLDFYLGTGDHDIATLVPNRMLRNLGGKRFVDISSSSGTGHLQKGHGVCCGDWNRDGSLDIAIQMGGAIPGDKYHNILFQNPGQSNNWLNVKLVGKTSNRCAIGARIKAVTAGANPQTIYRTICSGSSFGANPLEQLLGLGKADRVAELEVYWPTSKTTQVFRDIAVNQAIEIVESEASFKTREYKKIAVPLAK